MFNIDELMNNIRDIINFNTVQDDLISNSENWLILCSSMDMIEDTEEAIEGYFQYKNPISLQINYLIFFGVFQAMFVQQDAVKNLYKALGFKYSFDSKLEKIRFIRNVSFGHPTEKTRNGKTSSFVGRPTISLKKYKVSIHSHDERHLKRMDINIPEQIEIQRKIIESDLLVFLKKIINKYRVLLGEEIIKSAIKDYEVKVTSRIE